MRFIAEIISAKEIAVWIVSEAYVHGLEDGMYRFIGRLQSPIFPNYKSIPFETKNHDHEYHFQDRDYDSLIKQWDNLHCSPPLTWTLSPFLESTFSHCEKLPCFAILAVYKETIPTQNVVLNKKIEDDIKKQFSDSEYTFLSHHGVGKAILIGTI
jgi:hypothetical protein